jgi:hypothetical protein
MTPPAREKLPLLKTYRAAGLFKHCCPPQSKCVEFPNPCYVEGMEESEALISVQVPLFEQGHIFEFSKD